MTKARCSCDPQLNEGPRDPLCLIHGSDPEDELEEPEEPVCSEAPDCWDFPHNHPSEV